MWRKLALSVLKVQKEAIAQNLCWENFHDLLKICKNRESFLLLSFYHLRYV